MSCKDERKNTTNIYIVSSSSSKVESLYLAVVFVIIISLAFLLLKIREKPVFIQKITNSQISSYKDFNSVELGIYGEILNSLTDIKELKDEKGEYPKIKDLEEEGIPPFFKDETWKNKGEIEWELLFHDDIPIYLGKSNDFTVSGNFLIEIDRDDIDHSKIFYSKENINTSIVRNRFEDIKQQMKEIVSYTGNDERKKYKGD